MKTNFLPTDVNLSLPIIIFPIGHIGSKSIEVLNSLHSLSFNCPLDSSKYVELKQVCQSKNVPLPNEIRSKIFVLNDESDFSKIHDRFQLEPSLSFLKWFVVIVFIDGVLNNDIPHLQEYAKSLSISSDTNEFFHFFIFTYASASNNNSNDMYRKYKTNDNLFFFFLDDSSSVSSIIDNFISFLCPLVIQSIQNHISSIVTTDATPSRKKLRSNKSVSAIPRATLTFLSTNLADKVKIFTETMKIFDSEKNVDNQKYGEMFELLGILEMEHQGTAKKYQLLDRISSPYHWEFEEKNDILLVFSISASYFMKNLPSRALDCCFHIFSFFTSTQSSMSPSTNISINNSANNSSNNINTSKPISINNKTITSLINESIVIIEKLNDEDMMQNRGLELISHVSRLGQARRIPMICYQISKILRFRAKADFLIMGIRVLYEQNDNKNNQLIIQNLAEPMVETLLKSVVFPLEKCSIIFKILSTIGDFLPKEKQDFLFMKMIDLSIGDVRIPCDIGLKVSFARIIPPTIEIVEVNESRKTKSQSIFIYNALQEKNRSAKDRNTSLSHFSSTVSIGVGSQFRIEFDLFNPFSLDLPIFISCTKVNHCSSEDYPCPLKAKTNNKLVCCLAPIDEGEIAINSVDCVIYSGVQQITFPYPLKVKAVDGVASFSVRTELPIKQTIELFDGEVYHVRMWVTNTGSSVIENLSLRFDPNYLKMKSKMQHILKQRDYPKRIPPCENILIDLDFAISKQMEEISFDIVAQTALNKSYEAVYHVQQPIKVNPGLCIESITQLKSLPEPQFDMLNYVYVAVTIHNSTKDSFNYTASFLPPPSADQSQTESTKNANINSTNTDSSNTNDKNDNNNSNNDDDKNDSNNNNNNNNNNNDDDKSDNSNNINNKSASSSRNENVRNVGGGGGPEYASILTSRPREGILIGGETTIFILTIAKSVIKNPPIHGDRSFKISAARNEESKLGHKLTNEQRSLLDLRVDMAELIKASLDFKWRRGGVRQGILSLNNALPSESLLNEVHTKRPQTVCSLHYFGSDEELKSIQIKRKVVLNVSFKYASVKSCKVDLGIFSDSDYGIMWNGALEQEKTKKEKEEDDDDIDDDFDFIFYFTKSGNFTFTIKYLTFGSIKGYYPVNINVVDI